VRRQVTQAPAVSSPDRALYPQDRLLAAEGRAMGGPIDPLARQERRLKMHLQRPPRQTIGVDGDRRRWAGRSRVPALHDRDLPIRPEQLPPHPPSMDACIDVSSAAFRFPYDGRIIDGVGYRRFFRRRERQWAGASTFLALHDGDLTICLELLPPEQLSMGSCIAVPCAVSPQRGGVSTTVGKRLCVHVTYHS